MSRLPLAAVLVLLLAGCPPRADAPPDLITRVAQLSVLIDQSPENADILLEAEGMTPDRYRSVMFRIARDPEMTREFLQAQERIRQGARPAS